MAADINTNKPQNSNSNSNGFGLPKMEFKHIESTENHKWLKTTFIVAGVVLLIGAGIVFWLFKHHSSTKDFVSSTLQKHQAEDEGMSEDTLENNNVPAEAEPPSNPGDEMVPGLKELSQDFHAHTHKHVEENQQEPPIKVINAPTGLYHVIIASYIDVDLAMDHAKKISKKGPHSQIITPVHGGHFARLSIAQAATPEEAKQRADELKAAYGDHIWVMKY